RWLDQVVSGQSAALHWRLPGQTSGGTPRSSSSFNGGGGYEPNLPTFRTAAAASATSAPQADAITPILAAASTGPVAIIPAAKNSAIAKPLEVANAITISSRQPMRRGQGRPAATATGTR